jgi:hypothetical protein
VPTWRGFTFALVIFLGGLALLIGASIARADQQSRVGSLESALRCATYMPASDSKVPATYPACAVWIATQVLTIDAPRKGPTTFTLQDGTGGLWTLDFSHPSDVINGLQDGQSVRMLVWQGQAVGVGRSSNDYGLDDASPQTAAGAALGAIFVGVAVVFWSGTAIYSNVSRRRNPQGLRRRVGITPLVLINACVAVPCCVGGLALAGSGPDTSVGAIVALSFTAVMWFIFGALLWRQHRRRREGLPA